MVDDLDRDLPSLRLLEGIGSRRVQRRPGGLIDLGSQGALESIVRGIQNGVFDNNLFFYTPVPHLYEPCFSV